MLLAADSVTRLTQISFASITGPIINVDALEFYMKPGETGTNYIVVIAYNEQTVHLKKDAVNVTDLIVILGSPMFTLESPILEQIDSSSVIVQEIGFSTRSAVTT